MLEDAIKSEGVEEVFSTNTDVNAEAVDLFSDEYLARISRIKLPNTKVKILAQLLKKKVNEFKRVNKIKVLFFMIYYFNLGVSVLKSQISEDQPRDCATLLIVASAAAAFP